MHEQLSSLLASCSFTKDFQAIYAARLPLSSEQEHEQILREKVAGQSYVNYLDAIAHSHSIPVMDYEVDRYLAQMPKGALILDIGGCWGWHWRRLATTR